MQYIKEKIKDTLDNINTLTNFKQLKSAIKEQEDIASKLGRNVCFTTASSIYIILAFLFLSDEILHHQFEKGHAAFWQHILLSFIAPGLISFMGTFFIYAFTSNNFFYNLFSKKHKQSLIHKKNEQEILDKFLSLEQNRFVVLEIFERLINDIKHKNSGKDAAFLLELEKNYLHLYSCFADNQNSSFFYIQLENMFCLCEQYLEGESDNLVLSNFTKCYQMFKNGNMEKEANAYDYKKML